MKKLLLLLLLALPVWGQTHTEVTVEDAQNMCSKNGVLAVATGCYASLQAAHDALPSTGGTVFVTAGSTPFGAANTTALAITKPIHVIFDASAFTYAGTGTAITCSSTRAVNIEGAGNSGDGNANGGTTLSITGTAVNGFVLSACPGVILANMDIVGPGSGSGVGVTTSSTRGIFRQLVIRSWGSDGWKTDGTATNANEGIIQKVRSLSNGGTGFKLQGNNQQGYLLLGADAALNTGDNYSIANALNNFQGTNCSPNLGTDICYHFLSGANNNYGFAFADAPSPRFTYDSGSNDNYIVSLGGFGGGNGTSTGNTLVSDAGTRNQTCGAALTNGSAIGLQYTCLSQTSGSAQITAQRIQNGVASSRIGHGTSLAGTDYWWIDETDGLNSNAYLIRDFTNSNLIRLALFPGTGVGANAEINSAGTGAVQCNVRSGSGTGGCQFGDGAGNVKATIDSSGSYKFANLLLSSTAPTILAHFNTSGDSIAANNGTASFVITVGSGTGTSTGALTLPTATTGWTCWLTNQSRADLIQQTGASATSATFTNFGTTFAATNWTNGDTLRGGCMAN